MDTGYLRTLTNGLQLKYMKCITHSKAFQGQYSAFIYINLIHDAVYIYIYTEYGKYENDYKKKSS